MPAGGSVSPEPSRHAASAGAGGHQHGAVTFELGNVTLAGTRLRIQRMDAIQEGTAVGFAVLADSTKEAPPIRVQLLSSDGTPVSDLVRVPLRDGAGHAHLTPKAGQPRPARLRVQVGEEEGARENASLELEGQAVDLHAGHNHGIVARITDGGISGWLELKLHDDKGDLELWLYRDLKKKIPFDLPLDTAILAEFPEMGRTFTLSVRNREKNEDEAGQSNVREGKTNYFIFPGDSGQDPALLVGRSFSSMVKIKFDTGGVTWATAPFWLVPHFHGPGGHTHEHAPGAAEPVHEHEHAHAPGEGGQARAHDHPHDAATGSNSRCLVVDTDLGLDDVRALFALLNTDTLDLTGVVTTEGSASLGKATDNLTGLLESTGARQVSVVRGVPVNGKSAPPWRATANNLAGVVFPPPRGLTPTTESVNMFLERVNRAHPGQVHLLALGPLTNLAAFMDAAPEHAASFHTIWIPVTRTGPERVRAWNLGWNPEAARTALEKAPRVVLVDVSPAASIDLEKALADTSGQTPALRWIQRMLAATAKPAAHRFVYDELAAFAVACPEAIQISEEAYRLNGISPESCQLVRAENGNVRVATLKNPEQAVAWLKQQWARAPITPHTAHGHDHTHEHGLPQNLSVETYLRTFHGHLGPFVVIGYRMGQHALTLTGSDGHFGIRAHVHTGDRPPRSCLIDGIQLGAGCTLGKRNIQLTVEEGPSWVEFTTGQDQHVFLRLRPEVPGLVKKLVEDQGVEAAGRHFLRAPIETWLEVAP